MTAAQFKAAAKLFAFVFAGSLAVIMVVSSRNFSWNFIYFYKNGLSALATAMIWVSNGLMSEAFSEKLSWLKAPVKRLLFSLAATFVVTFIIWWFIASAWNAPTLGFDPMRPFRGFELSDFLPTLLITLFISIFMHGRSFLYEWRQSALTAEQLKKEHIAARYETLKNQVNPHFLFNSLNVLTALVHKDADMAEQFIRQLSAVYRYVLDSRDQEVVPLEEEIKQLEAFIYLMKIRFGNSFEATIDVPDRSGKVAPLTLQMLVENAIKHNEVSKSNPLIISIVKDQNDIVIQNNIQPKSVVAESSGVGLENIRARYQFLTDRQVRIEQTDQSFIVKIPIVETT